MLLHQLLTTWIICRAPCRHCRRHNGHAYFKRVPFREWYSTPNRHRFPITQIPQGIAHQRDHKPAPGHRVITHLSGPAKVLDLTDAHLLVRFKGLVGFRVPRALLEPTPLLVRIGRPLRLVKREGHSVEVPTIRRRTSEMLGHRPPESRPLLFDPGAQASGNQIAVKEQRLALLALYRHDQLEELIQRSAFGDLTYVGRKHRRQASVGMRSNNSTTIPSNFLARTNSCGAMTGVPRSTSSGIGATAVRVDARFFAAARGLADVPGFLTAPFGLPVHVLQISVLVF